MRCKPGDRVVLFDGTGAEFSAQVEEVGRADVRLAILARHPLDRELPVPLTLGVALPKGERQKWLVEKAVELGVGRLVPLRTSRSVAQPVEQALARLCRTVIEASKQCGRNRLMEITEPQDWADFVEASREAPLRILAHPDARSRPSKPRVAEDLWGEADPPSAVHLAVGPEGGFTSEEIALATAAGWRAVSLGPRILRIETAALLLVALATHKLVGRGS
jgi:16S rRNA (uracil1498-N3)-methyltransferase